MRTKLKVLRVSKGLNQTQMAAKCGVSYGVYSLIERGKTKGTSEFWVRLKNEFNLSTDDAWKIEHEIC